MSEEITDFGDDGGGYDADDWSRLTPFNGRIATLDDVQARVAVFALNDTADPRVIDMDLPQPVIWWEEGGEQAAVAVQAESHLGDEGDEMDVLGLILPDGGAAVALMEDCDLVDDTDPVWRKLVEDAIDPDAATD
ncbi:hypothetical protein [Brevundimonas sp. M20]|uniref:hypothetical protein n=1 Tax=Brevundimonas sp. M20 TaxID=2591463 RepID=UPI00114713F8|nr:hypothetical protein [Brevundimonas sp. M20]QDH73334.1 hypothetical protein FKQ52_07780 [Brevundimonas sp. M20]